MNSQLSLLDAGIPISEEELLYIQLKPAFLSTMKRYGLFEDSLTLKKKKNYYSVYICKDCLICRINLGNGAKYLSFHALLATDRHLLNKFEMYRTESDAKSGFIRVVLPDNCNITPELRQLIAAATVRAINTLPTDFDCCHRYNECSDRQFCVHPNPEICYRCRYCRTLASGRIFYGKNRNID